jgi:drug/metabolite transporter (DMT)-like permease
MALVRGFSAEAFRVASAVSAVAAAVISVLAGLLLGERLSPLSLAGMALALPAIVGVSIRPGDAGADHGAAVAGPPALAAVLRVADGAWQRVGAMARQGAGVRWGLAAGTGFGLSLIALNRAGSATELWPLAAAEVAAVATVGGVATAVIIAARGRPGLPPTAARRPAVLSGATAAAGMFCYFIATHLGLLAVTAVIYSFFPAITIVLAWRFDQEKVTRGQLAGLGLAAASVGLITIGGGR